MKQSKKLVAPPRNGTRYHALGYRRAARQDEPGASEALAVQELLMRQKLDRTFGSDNYEIRLISDRGVSGASGFHDSEDGGKARASLIEMKNLLLSKQFDAFIIPDNARLARKTNVFVEMITEVLVPTRTPLLVAKPNHGPVVAWRPALAAYWLARGAIRAARPSEADIAATCPASEEAPGGEYQQEVPGT
jgi:hypothetical protein